MNHLARRFAGSLWPAGPGVAGEAWSRQWLRSGEVDVWKAMSGPDRRHGLAVARRVAGALGNSEGAGIPRNALAAALLHDAGKSQSRLGVFGRTAATLLAAGLGRRRLAAWKDGAGWRAQAGRYAAHDDIGGDLLAAAGSDPVVVSWAREHHLPPAEWSLDPALAAVLKSADDD
jgi:hypothetical protein